MLKSNKFDLEFPIKKIIVAGIDLDKFRIKVSSNNFLNVLFFLERNSENVVRFKIKDPSFFCFI